MPYQALPGSNGLGHIPKHRYENQKHEGSADWPQTDRVCILLVASKRKPTACSINNHQRQTSCFAFDEGWGDEGNTVQNSGVCPRGARAPGLGWDIDRCREIRGIYSGSANELDVTEAAAKRDRRSVTGLFTDVLRLSVQAPSHRPLTSVKVADAEVVNEIG